jgi:hypothetical protein
MTETEQSLVDPTNVSIEIGTFHSILSGRYDDPFELLDVMGRFRRDRWIDGWRMASRFPILYREVEKRNTA